MKPKPPKGEDESCYCLDAENYAIKVSMKPRKSITLLVAGLVGLVLVFGTAEADSVNEKRVLKKAAGQSEGSFTNVVVTTVFADMSPPTTVPSFDRTGSVKIPKKKGSSSTTVVHDGPERENDTVATGAVRKPKVKRKGKKIVYKGAGQATPLFDNDSNFTGQVRATSKVKGKKVKSKGAVSGSRVKANGDVEYVSGNVAGEGKF